MTGTHLAPVFRTQVYLVVRAIPAGRVMTYGQIAALIPPPPGVDLRGYEHVKARWVMKARLGRIWSPKVRSMNPATWCSSVFLSPAPST